MKTMNVEQMETINGGGAAGCMFAVSLGFVGFVASCVVAPVTAGSAAVAVGMWYGGILGGCLL